MNELEKEKPSLDELPSKIDTIANLLFIAKIAAREWEKGLIPTALESAFEKMQGLIDDYCVEEG